MSRFTEESTKHVPDPEGEDYVRTDSAYRCDHCNGITAKRISAPRWAMHDDDPQIVEEGTYPPSVSQRAFRDVPDALASAAKEAWACFDVSAYRGAVGVARSVIEATAKDKGITVKGVATKINKLHDEQWIREDMKEAAHEIRYAGNDTAHGDMGRTVLREEAEELLGIMDEILHEVYTSRARTQRLRQAREARWEAKPPF